MTTIDIPNLNEIHKYTNTVDRIDNQESKNSQPKECYKQYLVDYKREQRLHIDKYILIDDEQQCNKCKLYNVVKLNGYFTCRDCGSENNPIIDNGQEWRYFSQYDNRSSNPIRCGIPTSGLVPNASIGSVISNYGKFSYGIKRLQRMQTWGATSYKDSTLINSFNKPPSLSSLALRYSAKYVS